MTYQFIVQLPQHLESAYQTGKIIVNSGVARYADSQQIAAHLEQVLPISNHALGIANPYLDLLVPGLQTAREIKGMTIDYVMLKRVLTLTQQVKTLSTINVAISGATLGVAVVGFALVLNQLNKFDQKISLMGKQLDLIARQQSELFKNEIRKLIRDVRLHIKHCITYIQQIKNLGWSDYLDTEISKLLDSNEVLIGDIIDKYLDRDSINVPLGLAQQLYNAYADLLKVYLTNRFLHNKDMDCPSRRLKTLNDFSTQLILEEIIDELYEEYLMQREKILTETELDYILDLYRCGCQNTSLIAHNHYEILNTTSLNTFKQWKNSLSASQSSLVWLAHCN